MDFSVPARRALDAAGLLAAPGASRELLFVSERTPLPVFGLPAPPLPGADRRKIRAALEALDSGASPRVEEGDPVLSILRRARASDLVVMGSHGREGLDRALLGSVCEAVVRASPVPVLMVRDAPPKARTVLAPVNLARYSSAGLLLAARAAAHLGAGLRVLCVSPDPEHSSNPRVFLAGMVARLPGELRKAVKPVLMMRSGDPIREILIEARRHGLVVLTAHRKSLLSDLVLGTTAERVLRHSPVPVLTAPSGR